ncbi:aspartic peptidase domain-containing protein [Suillus occidentalis]|nr:aspartic peptidase domain-containing protein [Suillus occidentalis]
MFPVASLLTILILPLFIAGSAIEIGNSPITLPIARRLNISDGPISLLQHDKARVAALKNSFSSGHAGSTPLTNSAVGYVAAVQIGSPATTYSLIVDTGSSNTWVGAAAAYVKTSTSVNTGTEYTDTVSFGSGLTITKQSIGVASTAIGFTGVDGILGIGPVGLTKGSLTNSPKTTIPIITENLHSEGIIPEMVVSVSFEPTTSLSITNGELTFGGTDATKYTGSIAYTPITTTYPASAYWGIDESITYGSTTILSSTAGIVDTGTTFLFIATDAYTRYQSATGASVDLATGLLLVSSAQYKALKNLDFHIGSVGYFMSVLTPLVHHFAQETYSLTPNAQIWPRSLNTYLGGSSGAIYLIIHDIGTPSGQGFDFINSYTFLERFYSVYDTTNSRVGFAKTKYTDATTN